MTQCPSLAYRLPQKEYIPFKLKMVVLPFFRKNKCLLFVDNFRNLGPFFVDFVKTLFK